MQWYYNFLRCFDFRTMMNSEEIDLLAGSKAEAEAETRGKSTLAENT